MSLLSLCQWIQSTPSSTWLRESTWGFPIVSAIHVLGIAWFGGTVVIPGLGRHLPLFQRTGFAFLLLTGLLLFWLEPVKCYHSNPFRLKMLLLALVSFHPFFPKRVSVILLCTLWTAILLAARWIAYY